MSVICFYVCFYHLFIFLKHNKDLNNLTFALCCFFIAVYVYLLIILMMSYLLIDKFVNATVKIENFNKILEYKVSERTKEIQSAYEKIKQLANQDHLTKLPNRRVILKRLELEKNRYERKIKNKKMILKNEFCIAIFDIDNFKKFNDKYGHECGDKALIHLANLIKTIIRKQDEAARWGGEEFLLIFPETDYEGAKIISEKIRKKVEDSIFEYNNTMLNITITIGVAVYQNLEIDIDQCIKDADTALYEGKHSGKNCVIIKNYKNSL